MSDAALPDQEEPDVGYHERPGPSRADRDAWPYLSHLMNGLRNGRETGACITGMLFGRSMHGERGLRVVVLKEHYDGAVTALVGAGVTVQHYHDLAMQPGDPDSGPPRSVIEVWV